MSEDAKSGKLLKQILKFGVVGGLAFLIDFAVYTIVLKLLHWEYGYMVAGIAGFSVSLIFNYIASMKFVFESKDDMDKKKEFSIFLILSLIGMALNSLILWLYMDVMYKNSDIIRAAHDSLFGLLDSIRLRIAKSPSELAALMAKIVATAIVMVYNFITRKIFLEKKE
ncbi:MAG: GtrA family protein [Lachnospiraceae bacterium]|nr:GtrA family protein [Lachnospiraceae bacterium]